MRLPPAIHVAAALFFCAVFAQSQAQTYQITELAPLGSSFYSRATAINNSGQVGGSSNYGAALWTNGVPTVVPGGFQVFAMNDAAHMAGQPYNDPAIHSAGGYFDGTTMVPIAPPAGWWLLYSVGINNGDAIVGQLGPAQFEGTTAFLWQKGSFTFLPALSGDVASFAVAVNDSNVAVGNSQTQTMMPVRWVGGVPQALGRFDPDTYNSATAINNAGVIVGQSGNVAFVWDETHGLQPLPLGGGAESYPIAIKSGGDILGMIDDNPVVWKSGAQGYTIVNIGDHLPALAEWSQLEFAGMNDSGEICGSGIHNGNYRGFVISSGTPTLETAYVDRDNPLNDWSTNRVMDTPQPVYAGDLNGDLIAWRIKNAPAGASFAWTAQQTAGLTHQTITGPHGTDQNQWALTDGELNWAPGTYHITCVITPPASAATTLATDQVLGWRTPEYVVVGQVRPIHDYDLSLARAIILNQAIVTSYMNPRESYLTAAAKLALLALPPSVNTRIWIAFQYLHYATSGASAPSFVPLRGAEDSDKYWMIQTMLDDYPDLVSLPDTLQPADLDQLTAQRSYRMFSHTQFRYLLNAAGTIDPASVTPVLKAWDIGPTKFAQAPEALRNLDVTVRGTEFDLSGNSQQSFITGEVGAGSGGLYMNASNTVFSFFMSGRVGIEGRVPNFALMGRDAPFIFAEVITAIGPDGRDTGSRIRLSVDQRWFPDGTVTGNNHFNEIRIFKRDYSQAGYGQFVLARNGLLEIANQLPAFLASGSTTWPGAAPTPTGN